MRKFLILFLSIIIATFVLNGCNCDGNKDYLDYIPQYGPQFVLLEEYDDPYVGYTKILVDKNTRIMYLYLSYCDNESNGKVLTPLYDSEGKVKRYTGAIID